MSHKDNPAELHHRALRLEWFTVGWNVVEAAVAIGAGILAGSKALTGFGADSLIETLSAVVVLWRLYRSGPRAKEEEHGRTERRALLLIAATFFLLAAFVAVESIRVLVNRQAPDTSMAGLILSLLSLLVMPILAWNKQRTGKEMGSRAIQADARETWICSWLSLALLVGIGLYILKGWWWADPAGALAMVPVILWQGWSTLGEARE